MEKISLNFFGTHEFAATILQGLFSDVRYEIKLVITQPDRPVGRKQILTPSPVKILAESLGLSVEQPESLKNYQLNKTVDLNVVAQYGLLIPSHILNASKYGTINVHTSLLPKYRGASPIQSALMQGETETGVTIMQMEAGLDTGPILSQEKILIDADDTYETLEPKMAIIGTKLLVATLPDFISGKIIPQKQNDALATVCRKLDRDTGHVTWSLTANEIYNVYRGCTPWPGIWTTWNNLRVKLLQVRPSSKLIAPGHIVVDEKSLFIGCANSALEVLELQIEGKKSQTAASFISGYAPHNQNCV